MREFEGFGKGVNLGGWLSQCRDHYNDKHYSTFITEPDMDVIKSWGCDHVRVPVDYNVVQREDGSFIESGFGYIDSVISWCEKRGMKMVLDLHKAPGFVFDDKECCQFFFEEKLQENFVRLWEEFSRRYAKYYSFVAFELLNEVTEDRFAAKWNEISARTIKAIRAVSRDVKIIIGGIHHSSIEGLELLEKPADENIVFTFHCYSPLLFTHQKAYWIDTMPADFQIDYPADISEYLDKTQEILGSRFGNDFFFDCKKLDSSYFEGLFARAVKVAEKYNVPLYCGEYGVIDRADLSSTLNWYKDINAALEKYNIARAAWCYREMDFGLEGEHYKDGINELVKYL